MTVLVPASAYRLARRYAVRLLGVTACATGAALLLTVLARALDWAAVVGGLLTVLTAVLGLATLCAALAVLRSPTLLRLDAAGFAVRWPGGRGVLRGSWEHVDDVSSDRQAGQPLALLRHRDGTTTSLLLGLLESPARDVEDDVRRRLNAAYGYRPLNPRETR
jgi:hypothetical protein